MVEVEGRFHSARTIRSLKMTKKRRERIRKISLGERDKEGKGSKEGRKEKRKEGRREGRKEGRRKSKGNERKREKEK